MQENVKNIIIKNKTLFQNFSFLTILQVFTLLFPLITYPYLIRVLGAELYGTVIYAQSITAYFTIIVNFGFNISATKDVSVHRDDKKKLSEIISSIYVIKTVLFIICFILFVLIVNLVPLFKKHFLLFIFTYFTVLGQVLLPIWFYQGIEKMKYMTYVSILSKLLFTILIFIFIRSKSDYLFVPILLALGSVFGGLISAFLVFVKEKIKFKIPTVETIFSYAKRTFPFFLSRISAVLSSETNTVVIGAYLGMKDVAYYDLAKKITGLFMVPNDIINTGVYPKIAKEKNLKFVKNIFYIRVGIAIFLYATLLIFGNLIIKILGGTEMLSAYNSTILYGTYIVISAVSYYIGGTVLVSFNYEKPFNLSVIYSLILYVVLLLSLIIFAKISLFSIIITFLVLEVAITLYRYYYCKKYKLL